MPRQHGGLTRAGKVKGQTPHVDKIVKAKTPKGLARKRSQFNRRFVNPVAGQRGPNTNPIGAAGGVQ